MYRPACQVRSPPVTGPTCAFRSRHIFFKWRRRWTGVQSRFSARPAGTGFFAAAVFRRPCNIESLPLALARFQDPSLWGKPRPLLPLQRAQKKRISSFSRKYSPVLNKTAGYRVIAKRPREDQPPEATVPSREVLGDCGRLFSERALESLSAGPESLPHRPIPPKRKADRAGVSILSMSVGLGPASLPEFRRNRWASMKICVVSVRVL